MPRTKQKYVLAGYYMDEHHPNVVTSFLLQTEEGGLFKASVLETQQLSQNGQLDTNLLERE